MDKLDIFLLLLWIVLALLIGFVIGDANATKQRAFDGCWASIKSGEDRGDWVCVNVQGMSYDRALEVCSHETGHEIFAEECEDNATICFEAIEYIKGKNISK